MTKKHFEAIARVFARYYTGTEDRAERALIDGIAREIAFALQFTDPLFDRPRFRAACRGEA